MAENEVSQCSAPESAIKCDTCLEAFWDLFAKHRKERDTRKAVSEVSDAVRATLANSQNQAQNMTLQRILMSCDPSRQLHAYYASDTAARLGAGAYGSVFSATHRRTGEEYAVKVILKDHRIALPEQLAAEIATLMSLDHHNVVRLFEYFEEEKYLYLVTELVKGGDLADVMVEGRLKTETQVNNMMLQLMHAIAYCHGKGVVHRDLKMDNCLLDGTGCLKVIDFGMARVQDAAEGCSENWLSAIAGTLPYMSPEIVDTTIHYGLKTDIWSAGVILYILLSGGEHPLWEHTGRMSESDMFDAIKTRSPNLDVLRSREVSDKAIDLIGKMLCKDPAERLSAKEVLDHGWFRATSVGQSDMCKTLCRIGHFNKVSKFEQAVLTVIAHQDGQSEVQDLESVFYSLDKAGNGRLSFDELCAGFQQCGLEVPLDDLKAVFDAYEVSPGSGQIEYTGWLAATMQSTAIASERAVKAAFAFFDADLSGSIRRDELLAVLGEDEASLFWRESGTEKMELSFQEFKFFMESLAHRRTTAAVRRSSSFAVGSAWSLRSPAGGASARKRLATVGTGSDAQPVLASRYASSPMTMP